MRDILIITDSASDVGKMYDLKHTKVFPLGFYLAGDEETVYPDTNLVSAKRLRELLNLDVDAYVMPINYDDLVNELLEAASKKMDVICIHVSDSFSYSTKEIFEKARDEVQLKHHDIAIAVIDSGSISLGEGYLVKTADDLVESNNYSFEEIVRHLYELRKKVRFDLITKSDNSIVNKFDDYNFVRNFKSLFNLDSVFAVGSMVKHRRLYKKGSRLDLILQGLYSEKNEIIGLVETGLDRDFEQAKEDFQSKHESVKSIEAGCVNNVNLGPKSLGIAYRKR